MNIYEKINAIMSEVQYLAKDDKVNFKSVSYRALSEEKVTSIMRAELVKYKLVVFPILQNASRQGDITHVDVVYRMVNSENPEESIEIASSGDGYDTQDKGSGKAMTYAFKYMWLRTFAIPTGEDPDKISSAELDARKKVDLSNAPDKEASVYETLLGLCTDEQIAALEEQKGLPIEMWDTADIVSVIKKIQRRKANA